MLCLGKKAARKGSIALAFETYFSAADLPTPPLVFGKTSLINEWGVLANDKHGCCVWSGAAHETMLWNAEAWEAATVALTPLGFSDQAVLTDYSAVTGFNPKDPDTDHGTDMQQAAAFRQKTGILDAKGQRHKIDSYVSLKAGNVEQVFLAAYLFGAVGVGIQFPKSAWEQFNQAMPWDPIPHSEMDGGHYTPCVGRNSHGNLLCITWGRLHAMTPAFLARYMDEGVAYLSSEMLRGGKFSRRGFDIDTLKVDLARLKG